MWEKHLDSWRDVSTTLVTAVVISVIEGINLNVKTWHQRQWPPTRGDDRGRFLREAQPTNQPEKVSVSIWHPGG